MKKFFFILSIIVFLFFLKINFSSAAIVNFWQMSPDDSSEKDYKWQYWDNINYIYSDFDIGTDLNGYQYFTPFASDFRYSLFLYPFDSPLNLDSYESGYRLWIFANKISGTDNYFRYKDNGGNYRYSSNATLIGPYNVAGDEIYTMSFAGVSSSFSGPYTYINIDSPKINNKIYAIVYTNEDLSYIDTQNELYSFLDSLLPKSSVDIGSECTFIPLEDQIYELTGTYNVIPPDNYDSLQIEISKMDPITNATSSVFYEYLLLDNNGQATTSAPFIFKHYYPPGNYKFRVRLLNLYQVEKISDLKFSEWFYCWTGSYGGFGSGASGSWDITATSSDYSFENEDFGLIGNYIRDVLLWLFKPSDKNLTRFNDLSMTLQTKIPFSYFYDIKTIINNASIPSTSPSVDINLTSLGVNSNISFISFDYISDFKNIIQTLFNVICWILLAIYFVKRIQTIF